MINTLWTQVQWLRDNSLCSLLLARFNKSEVKSLNTHMPIAYNTGTVIGDSGFTNESRALSHRTPLLKEIQTLHQQKQTVDRRLNLAHTWGKKKK